MIDIQEPEVVKIVANLITKNQKSPITSLDESLPISNFELLEYRGLLVFFIAFPVENEETKQKIDRVCAMQIEKFYLADVLVAILYPKSFESSSSTQIHKKFRTTEIWKKYYNHVDTVDWTRLDGAKFNDELKQIYSGNIENKVIETVVDLIDDTSNFVANNTVIKKEDLEKLTKLLFIPENN